MNRHFLTFIILISISNSFAIAQETQFTAKLFDKLTDEDIWKAKIYNEDSLLTQSNSLGYFQIQAEPGDSLIIKHEDYEDLKMTLPQQSKFMIGMELKNDNLVFEGGMKSFYVQLSKNIKYPRRARNRKVSRVVFAEILVDSVGNSQIVEVHNDWEGTFSNEVKRVFKKLEGTWDTKYSGKTLLLPLSFSVSTDDLSDYDNLMLPIPDKMLTEIKITGYSQIRTYSH